MMTKNRISKALYTAYEILSTAVITFAVLLAALYLCGIRMYHVKSGSMGALMPVGSVCFVNTYSKYEDIETGDVISFRVSDDMLVTHRAVQITERGITTRGDENSSDDPDPVTKDNFIGKTVFALPHAGCIFGFFHTLSGKIVLVTSAACLLILGRIYKEKDSEQQ